MCQKALPQLGIEPRTFHFQGRCSTNWACRTTEHSVPTMPNVLLVNNSPSPTHRVATPSDTSHVIFALFWAPHAPYVGYCFACFVIVFCDLNTTSYRNDKAFSYHRTPHYRLLTLTSYLIGRKSRIILLWLLQKCIPSKHHQFRWWSANMTVVQVFVLSNRNIIFEIIFAV